MNPTLNAVIATEHLADLRRAAARRHEIPSRPARAGAPAARPGAPAGQADASTALLEAPAVQLRLAHEGDAEALATLAALDDARRLEAPALIALVGDVAVAALSLDDGRVVANPFVHTAHAIALLRLRAIDLVSAPRPRRRFWHFPRLRLA